MANKHHKISVYATAIPVCIAIAMATVMSIKVHLHLKESVIAYFSWVSFQALGAVFIGFASDLFCRKKIFILTQVFGIATLLLIILTKEAVLFLPILGLLFHPYSVGLAGMIDNFPQSSKVKIAAICFLAFLFPWVFYNYLFQYEVLINFAALIVLIVNIIFSAVFFFDRRDERVKHKLFQFHREIHPKDRKKFLFTFLAFFFTQLAYFFINTFVETSILSEQFYIVLAMGSIVGCGFAFFYKKLPHVSILTITYGIAFFTSIIPLIYSYVLGPSTINATYIYVVVGCLGGFFIPFVYDVLVNSVSPTIRGTSCGLIEFNYSVPHLISALLLKSHFLTLGLLLVVIPLCYFFSVILQKRAESHTKFS
ncbi:MAG: MFS transporter [Simkaniaceae bacterium]|nr:MFS transporter [Simkaniaceae bacterium]